jgi:hypothetical protein
MAQAVLALEAGSEAFRVPCQILQDARFVARIDAIQPFLRAGRGCGEGGKQQFGRKSSGVRLILLE